MITLYTFPGNKKLESNSPFCLRIELYLKLNHIPYETKIVMDPSKAPKGKLPYITCEDDTISDSSHIMDYLERKYPIEIHHDISQKDHAKGHLLEILCNEHLYWTMVHMRWVHQENSAKLRDRFFKSVPKVARKFVFSMVQKKVKEQLYHQGLGRHTQEEINEFGIKDIQTLSHLLGERPYFLGDNITRYDITIYSVVGNFLYSDFESPIVNEVKSYDNLLRFCNRIQGFAFPSN